MWGCEKDVEREHGKGSRRRERGWEVVGEGNETKETLPPPHVA